MYFNVSVICMSISLHRYCVLGGSLLSPPPLPTPHSYRVLSCPTSSTPATSVCNPSPLCPGLHVYCSLQHFHTTPRLAQPSSFHLYPAYLLSTYLSTSPPTPPTPSYSLYSHLLPPTPTYSLLLPPTPSYSTYLSTSPPYTLLLPPTPPYSLLLQPTPSTHPPLSSPHSTFPFTNIFLKLFPTHISLYPLSLSLSTTLNSPPHSLFHPTLLSTIAPH